MGVNIDRWILPGGYELKQHQPDNEFQPYKLPKVLPGRCTSFNFRDKSALNQLKINLGLNT